MPFTVVALGDSTTAGTPGFLSPIEAPPDGRGDSRSQYAYWLEAAHAEWRVFNRGANGQRTDQILARFDRDVLGSAADVVVIIGGVNDAYQHRDAATACANLRVMYDRALAAHLRVVAGTVLPYHAPTTAAAACMRAINMWIAEEAARDSRLIVVNTRGAVARADDPDELSGSPDGLHPDVDGYRRMAAVIAPALERICSEIRR